MSSFDPYPSETKWRTSLPMNSSLNFLMYGLMTEFIEPLVQTYRDRDRKNKVQKLIDGSTNDRLDEMVYNLKRGMPRLASQALGKKFWSKSKGTKRQRIDWYNGSGLSIEYLQDTYDKCISGPNMFKRGDRLMLKSEWTAKQAFVVIEPGKKLLKCMKCPWENKEGGVPFVNWEKCVIDSVRFLSYDSENIAPLVTINAWHVEKVGEDSFINIMRRDKYIDIYRNKARIRDLFWVRYLRGKNVDICRSAWFFQGIDVWNLTTIPDGKLFIDSNHGLWITSWLSIMEIVKSNFVNFKSSYKGFGGGL